MYTSRVLSCTMAPCGHPAWTSSRLRTAAPGTPARRARIRNSVGVRSTASPRLEAAQLRGGAHRRHLELVFSQAAREKGLQLEVVLEHEHVRVDHCSRSIPPSGSALMRRRVMPLATPAAQTEDKPSTTRKLQGTA